MSKAHLGESAEFKYPQNLIYDVLGKTSDAPDIDASVEYILSARLTERDSARLTEREASMLKMRYKDLMTYNEISKKYNLTANRIAQIIAKVQRKLRHPKNSKYLTLGVAGIMANEKEKLLMKLQENKKQGKKLAEHYTIEELDLSIRSTNCLLRAGLRTAGDVLNLGANGLMEVRNLGKRSYDEIVDRLEALGFDVRSYRE